MSGIPGIFNPEIHPETLKSDTAAARKTLSTCHQEFYEGSLRPTLNLIREIIHLF